MKTIKLCGLRFKLWPTPTIKAEWASTSQLGVLSISIEAYDKGYMLSNIALSAPCRDGFRQHFTSCSFTSCDSPTPEMDAYFESVELAGVMSAGSATNKKGGRL